MAVYGLLVVCVFLWSANFVIGRFVAGSIEPLELAFFRWMGVLIVVSPLLILQAKKLWTVFKKNKAIMSLLALLGIASFNTLLYIGLGYTSATNALLINSSIPILILLFSRLILHTSLRPLQIAGIVFSTVGVVFLVLKGDVASFVHLRFNQGDLWVIASSTSWALYSVLVKFRPKELSSFEFFMSIVALGVLMLLPFYLFKGYTLAREIGLIKTYYGAIAYVVIFPSLVSYYLWHKGIARIGAEKTGQFTHLMPLFGSFLAYLVLGERLEWYHLGGALLIGMGIYFSLFINPQRSK